MIANPETVAKTLSLKNVGSQYQGACPVCGGRDRFWISKQGKFGCRRCSDNTALTRAVKNAGAELPDSASFVRDRSQRQAVANTQMESAANRQPTPADRVIELPPVALKAYGLPCDPADHPYVSLKGMCPKDCYIANVPEFAGKQALVIPVRTHYGFVVGYQAIGSEQDASGKFLRRYNRGFDKSEVAVSLASNSVGELSGTVYLTEGWATGMAIVNSGFCAIWMLDANHLAQNAKRLANTYPDLNFAVAADNDKTGLEAAETSGLDWVVPPENGQDFWDLYATEGDIGVINVLDPNREQHISGFGAYLPAERFSSFTAEPIIAVSHPKSASQSDSRATACPLLTKVLQSADVAYDGGILRIDPHVREGVSHEVDRLKVRSWLQRQDGQKKNVDVLEDEVLSLLDVPIYRYIGYKTGVFNNGKAKGVKLSFVDINSGESLPLFFNVDLLYSRGPKKGMRRPNGEFTPKEHSKFMAFWKRTSLPEARYHSEYNRQMGKLESLKFVSSDPRHGVSKDNIQPLNLTCQELKNLLLMH